MACDLAQTCVSDGACASVFSRVVVSYIIKGGTFIAWELQSEFADAGPYTFQVQVGTTQNNDADDWEDVGFPVENQFAAIDDVKRVHGMELWTHYRVILTTSKGTYISQPTGLYGTLSKGEWLDVREIARQARVNLQKGHSGQPGFLLKRRITGIKCNTCTDFVTGAVDREDCPECYGTGYSCGYYYPIECVWAGFEPTGRHMKIDQKRATVQDKSNPVTLIPAGLGVMGEGDVWVSLRSDERYFVHDIRPTMLYRNVPVILNVKMNMIPLSSSIYDIAIPQQMADVSMRYFKGVYRG